MNLEFIKFLQKTDSGEYAKRVYNPPMVPRIGDKVEFGDLLPLKVSEVVIQILSGIVTIYLEEPDYYRDDQLNFIEALEVAGFGRIVG